MSANNFSKNSQRKSSTFNQYESHNHYDTVSISNKQTGELFKVQKFQSNTNQNLPHCAHLKENDTIINHDDSYHDYAYC